MGGTTGTPTDVNQNTLAGSRSTLVNSPAAPTAAPSSADFSSWLASVPQWAGTETAAQLAAGKSLSPLMMNPTAQAVQQAGPGTPVGFQSAGYNQPDPSTLPHIGVPADAKPAEAEKPKEFPKPTSFSNTPFVMPVGPEFDVPNWYTVNPDAVRRMSQAFADAGWDYTSKENSWYPYLGNQKVYWPGEPRS